MNTWHRLLNGLAEKQIRYVLVGGMAVNLHGVPRMTADLDLALAPDPDNTERFLKLMAGLGYVSRVSADPRELLDPATRQRWIDEKGMVAFTFRHPQTPFADVDILLSPAVPFDELWEGRITKHLGVTKVFVAAIPHLKAMKNAAGRKQDLADIEALAQVERIGEDGETKRPEV